MRVLQAVEEVNENQKSLLFDKLVKQYNGNLEGKTVALWGLAFKPETDDMREAPALVLIDKLLKAGCKVRAYDPAAANECKDESAKPYTMHATCMMRFWMLML